MGNYSESEKMFEKALEMNPKSEAYLGLGWTYYQEMKYEKAEEVLKAFLENIREKGEVYYTLGQVYIKQGRKEEAKKALEKAVKLNPDNQMFKDNLNSL